MLHAVLGFALGAVAIFVLGVVMALVDDAVDRSWGITPELRAQMRREGMF